MNALLNAWVPCMLIAIILQIVLIYEGIDLTSDKLIKTNEFLVWLSGLLSLIGFILFIIWLFQFKNKKVLKNMWIGALIALVVFITVQIFADNTKLQLTSGIIYGYASIIFIGSLIAFSV
jgi:hypothetical protein